MVMDAKKKKPALANLEMPKDRKADRAAELDLSDLNGEDEGAEDPAEEAAESPEEEKAEGDQPDLASISDEDLLAEIKKRGLEEGSDKEEAEESPEEAKAEGDDDTDGGRTLRA